MTTLTLCCTYARYLLALLLLLFLLPSTLQATPLSADELVQVTAQLADKDPAVRLQAAKRLGENIDQRVGEPLRTAMKDADPAVRAVAVQGLGKISYEPARQELIAALKDADPGVRAAAARAIWGYKNEKIVDALFALLQDADAKVRAAAVCSLGRTCIPRVLEPMRMMLDDESPLVRAEAARALGGLDQLQNWVADLPGNWTNMFGDTVALSADDKAKVERIFQEVGWDKTKEALATLLEDKDSSVRGCAALSLQKLRDKRAGGHLLDGLQCADPQVRRDILWTLCNTREPKIIDTCLAMLKQEQDPEALRALVHLLGAAQDRRAVDPLIAALPTADPKLRGEFIWALGWIQDSGAANTVIPFLKDTDAGVRGAAAMALGMMHAKASTELVLPLLNDADQSVRRYAVMAFGSQPDPRTVKPLLALLADKANAGIRDDIITALGSCGDNSIVDPLLALLKDAPELRQNIIRTLGRCSDPRAIEAVVAALKDNDAQVRQSAMSMLWSLNTQQVCQLAMELLKDPDVNIRRQMVGILRNKYDNSVVDPLLIALKDTDASVRRTAIEGLSNSNDQRGQTALQEVLKNDTDKEVRIAAAKAVIQMSNNAPELFFTLVKSPDADIRKAAIDGVNRTDEARTIDALLAALKDDDAGIRASAAKKLNNARDPRVIDPLIAALKDASLDVRVGATQALGAYHEVRVGEALVAQVKDADERLRSATLGALMQNPHPKVADIMLEALNDPSQYVRHMALQGINPNNPRGVQAAQAALKDDSAIVRQMAMEVLRRSTAPESMTALLELLKGQVKEENVLILAMLEREGMSGTGYGQEAQIDALARALRTKGSLLLAPGQAMLQDPAPLTRAIGAVLLVHACDNRALPALMDALKDDAVVVRRLAARALRRLGDVRSLPDLLAALNDPSDDVRAEAILALGEVQDARAVEPLLALLQAKQADLRFAAVWALGCIGDAHAAAPLVALYPNADEGTRAEIMTALQHIGDPHTADFLLTVLNDHGAPEFERTRAAQALGALREQRAVDALLEATRPLSTNNFPRAVVADPGEIKGIRTLGYVNSYMPPFNMPTLRSAALTALGTLSNVKAFDCLTTALADGDFAVNKAAAQGLAGMDDPKAIAVLVARLASDDWKEFQTPLQCLSESTTSDAIVEALLIALQDPNPIVRKHVVQAISRIASRRPATGLHGEIITLPPRKDPRFMAPLLALLPTADVELHGQLLNALAALGDPRAKEPILAALTGPDKQLRHSAVYALQTFANPDSVPLVIALLKDPNAETRSLAAYTLYLLKDARTTDALAAVLADPDDRTRGWAAVALGMLGDQRARTPLETLFTAKKPDGQTTHPTHEMDEAPQSYAVLIALVNLDDPAIIDELLKQAPMTDSFPGRYALEFLWMMDTPKATDALLGLAQHELAKDGKTTDYYSSSMDQLLTSLIDSEQYASFMLAKALPGRLTDERVLNLCISLLDATPHAVVRGNSFREPLTLRQKAIWALGRSASTRAVPPLLQILEKGTLQERREAALSLGRLKDPRAVAPLITALREFGADARPAVAGALKAITGQDFGVDADRWQQWATKK